jgi:hypothetical protein
MTVKLPKALLVGWKALFAAAWREGYPDGVPADQGEAWARFREGLPAALFRPRSVACTDPALALVAGWLTEEHIAATALGHGLTAEWRPAPGGGVVVNWSDAEGNRVGDIYVDHN